MKKMQSYVSTLLALALLAVSVFIVLPTSALAESVKADPQAAKGCIPKVSKDQALEVMRKFHFHSFNARPSEIRTLGTALYFIEKLNDGAPLRRAVADPDANYGYSFHDAHRNSHQASNEIRVNRNGTKHYGENVAQLVHELGHYIGNNGGYTAYYDAVDGHYCKVSTYSDDNFHEQYAEVFAAFVTRPALIKRNHSTACKKAFKFFSEVVFPDSEPLINKCIAHQDGKPEKSTGKKSDKSSDDSLADSSADSSDNSSNKTSDKKSEKSSGKSSSKPSKKIEFKVAAKHDGKDKKSDSAKSNSKSHVKSDSKTNGKSAPKSSAKSPVKSDENPDDSAAKVEAKKSQSKSAKKKSKTRKNNEASPEKPTKSQNEPKAEKKATKHSQKTKAKSKAAKSENENPTADSDMVSEPQKLEILPKPGVGEKEKRTPILNPKENVAGLKDATPVAQAPPTATPTPVEPESLPSETITVTAPSRNKPK